MAHSLIVDLLMRTGSFETDTARAARTADRRAKEIERSLNGAAAKIRATFAGLGLGISLGAMMQKFTTETVNFQNEQAQLAAALKSTGEAAGYTQRQLNEMAAAQAQASLFSEGDINRAQARLLSYTGVVGQAFPEAMQAAIDMATRMGMTVEQATETVGRALDVPSQGLTALQKQGFRFTEEQKKAVEQLEATGRAAEAQAMILDGLHTSYGGAAEAARNTFGGSVSALREQLNSLMTGDIGSLDGARVAVDNLTNAFGSAETREAFSVFNAGLATVVETLANGSAALMRHQLLAFAVRTTYQALAISWANVTFVASAVGREIGAISAQLAALGRGDISGFRAISDAVKEDGARARQELDDYERLIMGLGGNGSPARVERTGAVSRGTASYGADDEVASLARQREQALAATRAGAENARRIQAYTDNLQRQLRATRELSVAETLLADIREGHLTGATAAERAWLAATAEEIDLRTAERVEIEGRDRALRESLRAQHQARQAAIAQVATLAQSVETPLEQMKRQLSELNEMTAQNPLLGGNAQLVERLRNKVVDDWLADIKEVSSELDAFGKRFAENTQDLLGDTIYNAWKGDTDNLLKLWGDMLLRMLAHAQAANLARALFGEGALGALGGGWLTSLGSAVGRWLGGGSNFVGPPIELAGTPMATGTNYVPYDNFPALLHRGEAVVPAEYNPAAGGHGGGQAPHVEVNVIGAPAGVQSQSTRRGADGRTIVDVVLRAVAADVSQGGATARGISSRFGLSSGAGLTRRRGGA